MAGSTISSTITNQVTLSYGVTLSPLTVTNTGDIDYAGGYAILAGTNYVGTIVNDGSIIGRTDGIYAPFYAVTIFNHGTIHGVQAGILLNSFIDGPNVVVNSAVISGNAGIEGSGFNVTNTGSIAGINLGIRLTSSTIVNSGTITGQTGVNAQQDAVSNSGLIDGIQTGLYLSGGTAVNSGSILGGVGVRITNVAGPGSLFNQGTIAGGVTISGGVLDNSGNIAGSTGLALEIGANATNSGEIYGQSYGVMVSGPVNASGETLVNTGTIYSPGQGISISAAYVKNIGNAGGGDIGVAVSGGLLANYGLISSPEIAAAIIGGSLVNSGTLAGAVDGITIAGGGVTNFDSISGGSDGALLVGGSLGNYGRISGQVYGVADSGASVSNYGMITSAADGLYVSRGMVTNAGTIAGGVNAVYGSFITLGVDPGAVFVGDVVNHNGPSLLALEGAGVGTLVGIGTQIRGFNAISFGSGASWMISGTTAGLADGVPISGMGRADTIILDGFAATYNHFVNGSGLELSNSTATVTLDITGNFSNGGLQVTESGGNTVITDVTCYAAGTRIATPGGNIAVEQLKIGDLVRTQHAGDQAIKWIGWRRYDGRLIHGNLAALPVRIGKNAIADGVPERDLWVSPGHAIAIDNVLVHASRLVNGVSVVQLPAVESVTYYHIELASHEILFAENCPAESFQDEHFRQQFANVDDYRRRYPSDRAPVAACLPRLEWGFQLAAIGRRVAMRAGIAERPVTGALRGFIDQTGPERCFGWAQDIAAPAAPVSLDILSAGRLIGRALANLYRGDVLAAGLGDGYQGFEILLPAGIAGAIEVRRTSDGAWLQMADLAVSQAA